MNQRKKNTSNQPETGSTTGSQERGGVKRIYNISLKTSEDVRRLLSTTINQLRKREVAVDQARAIFYGSSVLLAVLEQGTIEKRLSKLEEAVQSTEGQWR